MYLEARPRAKPNPNFAKPSHGWAKSIKGKSSVFLGFSLDFLVRFEPFQ
jgi:hypothetical protein